MNGDDDLLFGAPEYLADTLLGGAGDDYLVVAYSDSADGGAGTDTLHLNLIGSPIGIIADFRLLADGGTLVIGATSLTGFEYTLGAGLSQFDDDVIAGPIAPGVVGVTFYGYGGNDRLVESAGVDYISGGDGNDTIVGGTGFDPSTSASRDRLFGDNGDDVIFIRDGGAVADGANGNDTIYGGAGRDEIIGGSGDDLLLGGGGDDGIQGDSGNDYLDGGEGADLLSGGAGNDTYVIDNAADVIYDPDGGIDQALVVVATIQFTSYTLARQAEVELIALADGSASRDFSLTGNAISQTIVGNAGANRLTGGGGADTLIGLRGDDTYVVSTTSTVIREAAGEGNDAAIISAANYLLAAGASVETLSAASGTAAINIAGNELAQIINGNDGANILSGNGGDDTLNGGLGDDVYRVFSTGTVISDTGGYDTVYASGTSYFLYSTAAIEYLSPAQQSATDPIYLVGNGSAQLISGNYGDNIINGRGTAGANNVGDTLVGLFGNDVYQVLNQADVVRESAGQGNDIIYAPVSYQLRAGTSVEALSASQQTANAPEDAITLRGNEIAQTIVGNDAANALDGRGGNDTLIGRGGSDVFAFTTALDSASNVDTIQDFAAGDSIGLASDIFANVTSGGITASEFVLGTAALDGDDRLLYDQAAGKLYYDADANGSGAAVLFAQLAPGTALTAASFAVIAPVVELAAA